MIATLRRMTQNMIKRHRELGCSAYCDGDVHAIVTYRSQQETVDHLKRKFALAFPDVELLDVRHAPECPMPEMFYCALRDGYYPPKGEWEPYLLVWRLRDGGAS